MPSRYTVRHVQSGQNIADCLSRLINASKAHDAVPVFGKHPLRILNAKTIKFWDNEGQLVSLPEGQCMDRLSKEYKRDAYPMVSRPIYANKCLITSLSAKLVLNLLSKIHYTYTYNYNYCLQLEIC